MKQFVGLYAVGCSKPDANTPVYLTQLASDKNLPSEPRFVPLGLMTGLKVGLYVGVVTFEKRHRSEGSAIQIG